MEMRGHSVKRGLLPGWVVLGWLTALLLMPQSVQAQADLRGAPGGVLKTFELPRKGKLTAIIVYGDKTVNGLQFEYLADRDFPSTETKSEVFGSAAGTSRRIQVLNRLPLKSSKVSWGDALSSISIEWAGQTSPPETVGSTGPYSIADNFPVDLEISGARVRSDSSRVYALAFGTRPWTYKPASGATIAKPLEAKPEVPVAPAEEFEFAGAAAASAFQFGGKWQTADGDAGRISLVNDASRSTLVNVEEAKDDYCLLCGTYSTPAVIRIMPLDHAGNQIRIRFDRYPGQEVILRKQDQDRPTKDGLNQGPTWERVGGGMTATFYPFDVDVDHTKSAVALMKDYVNWRLDLTLGMGASHTVGGETRYTWTYERPPSYQKDAEAAKLAMAKDLALEQKDRSLDNPYLVNSTVGAYTYLLHGYDGTNLNLLVPNQGAKNAIFIDPEPEEWDIAKSLSDPKLVPRGLLAVNRSQHGTRYSDTTISNEAEAHNELGFNFGIQGGPQGAELGVNYSRTVATGVGTDHDAMMALGVSRSYNYALVLDKSNLKLTNSFKSWVRQYLMPLRSATEEQRKARDGKYDEFVKTFGTHYANAVTFGGIGVAKKTFTSDAYIKWRQENSSLSVQGGAGDSKTGPSGQVSGGINKAEGEKFKTLIASRNEEFKAVGGQGVNEHSYNVPLQSSVPVLFDLRPISEIISGLWFDEPDEQLLSIRSGIDAAVARRFAKVMPLKSESRRPKAYKVEVTALYCRHPGSLNDDNIIELRHQAKVTYTDDRGGGTIEFLNKYSDGDVNVKCDNRTPYRIDKSATLWTTVLSKKDPTISADISNLVESGEGGFLAAKPQNFSSSTDKGLQGPSWPQTIPKAPRWAEGEFTFTGGQITRTFGNTDALPKLRLTYRVQQIE